VLPEVQLLPVNLAVIPPIDYGDPQAAPDEQALPPLEDESGSAVPWFVWLAVPLALLAVVGVALALRGRRPQ
jgi:hypothetical protein